MSTTEGCESLWLQGGCIIIEKKKIIVRKNLSHWSEVMHGVSVDTPIFVFTPLYKIQMQFIVKAKAFFINTAL